MNKLARNTLALGTATMIVTAGLSFAATGADATKSYSTGRFLSGSILGQNLDNLAQVKGVTAANPGNASPGNNPLNLSVLGANLVNLPQGVTLDVAKLLSPSGSAGAVNQYAAAESTSSSTGASGLVSSTGAVLDPTPGVPADSRISLSGGPLAGINDKLASVDLGIGALSSATKVSNGSPSRGYKVAGLTLGVNVPLLGDLVSDLNGELAPLAAGSADIANIENLNISASRICPLVNDTLVVTSDALLTQLRTLKLDALADALDPILNNAALPIGSVNLCDAQALAPLTGLAAQLDQLVSINVTGLGSLFTGIADISTEGVTVDLDGPDAGRITLDLAKIVDLNNLPPNTNVLKYLTSDLISNRITKVLDAAIKEITTNLGNVKVDVTLGGQPVPTVGLTEVTGPLNTLLTQVSDGVKALGGPVDDALAQLVPSLNQIFEITANNQSTSKTPTLSAGTVGTSSASAGKISAAATGDYFRTSALKVNVKPLNLLNVDLAASEAATLAADRPADQQGPGDDRSDGTDRPNTDDDSDSDSVADGAQADNGDDSDTVADADAQADADVTTTLPSTGAPNLLPFWLLGIALLLFGGAVLLNEKRRLNQV
jgi:hypothetical protein